MRCRLLGLVIVLVAVGTGGGALGADPGAANPAKSTPPTFWLVPHTHWEGAVFKTREEYLDMGLVNIQRALRLLETAPEFRFTLDQACYVQPFVERFPEQLPALKKFIAEGRLAIVGGTDVMPDVNMPGGESFVRQILYGKRFFRRALGVDVSVGWQLDTFGHHAQMPQILKLAGYRSFWFFRGVPNWDVPSEFVWEGLDGSKIPAYWLPQGYAHTYGSPTTLPDFSKWMKDRYDALARQSRGPDRVGLGGADVCLPEEHLPRMVRLYNQQPNMPLRLRLAVPGDFENAVADRKDRPLLTGELNPIFQGAYSSRIELKQMQRDLERLLATAEKLSATTLPLGMPADSATLWRAWEPVLFNQTHDLASGVMTDHVYEDTLASYRFSRRTVLEVLENRLQSITSRIDTRGEGTPLVVWNMLGWPRSDLAEAEVSFSEPGVEDVAVLDSNGGEIPVQVRDVHRGSDGLLSAHVSFTARDVPAMGYAVYRTMLRRAVKGSRAAAIEAEQGVVLENDRYRVRLDPASGAMTSLLLKRENWEALSGPANVVSRQQDHGDLWELYQPLDGGSRIAMTRKQAVPRGPETILTHPFVGKPAAATRGPVFSEVQVSHPFGAKGTFATRVRLYAGLPRIDLQTRIVNQDRFVRYQALFPTSIRQGLTTHEIPFGAVQRPEGIEMPAQNWADYGDGKCGLLLLNRGLPGNVTSEGTMMLSLLRSTQIVAYGFGGGYEPGMSSESGFELGQERVFDYALVPHQGDWRDAQAFRHGLEFNNPLVVRKSTAHAGSLPKRWGALEVSHPDVVVSAWKPGPQGSAILRIYEAAGKAARDVTIRLAVPVAHADEANLLEEPTGKVEVAADALHVDLRPFEIKTIRLERKEDARGRGR